MRKGLPMLPSENGCDALKGTSLSRGFAPSAGNPFANTVSEREANDQSDCNFKHRGRRDNAQGEKEPGEVNCPAPSVPSITFGGS